MFFFDNSENLKVARTGYFVIILVTRLFKCPTLLKPALYTVVYKHLILEVPAQVDDGAAKKGYRAVI